MNNLTLAFFLLASVVYGQVKPSSDMNQWRFSRETAHIKFKAAFPEDVWYEGNESELFGSDEGFDILYSFVEWRRVNSQADTWHWISALTKRWGYVAPEEEDPVAQENEALKYLPMPNEKPQEEFRLYLLSQDNKWLYRKSFILAAFAQLAYEGIIDEKLRAKAIEYVEFELVPDNMKQWESMAEGRRELYERYLRTLKSLAN